MLKALDSKGVTISPQTLVTDQNGLVNCELFPPNFVCPTTPNGKGTLEGDARLSAKFFVDVDGDNSLDNGEPSNGFGEIPIVEPCPQELIPCALVLCRILAEGNVIVPGPVLGPTPASVAQVLTRKPDKEEAERAILRAACRFLRQGDRFRELWKMEGQILRSCQAHRALDHSAQARGEGEAGGRSAAICSRPHSGKPGYQTSEAEYGSAQVFGHFCR